MTQWVKKGLANKPDSHKLPSDLHILVVAYVYAPYTHTPTPMRYFKTVNGY